MAGGGVGASVIVGDCCVTGPSSSQPQASVGEPIGGGLDGGGGVVIGLGSDGVTCTPYPAFAYSLGASTAAERSWWSALPGRAVGAADEPATGDDSGGLPVAPCAGDPSNCVISDPVQAVPLTPWAPDLALSGYRGDAVASVGHS